MQRLAEYITLHPLLVALAVLAAIAVLVYEMRLKRTTVAAIQPQEAIQLMNQGVPVYDLREAEEYAAGHISGARNLTSTQRDSAADHLKKFREKLLVLVDEDGSRAATLTRTLHAAGFTKVFNVRGGLKAWRAEGLPLQRG